MTPPVEGALFLAALVASCLRGALPPVDLRAVCLVRAIFVHSSERENKFDGRTDGRTGQLSPNSRRSTGPKWAFRHFSLHLCVLLFPKTETLWREGNGSSRCRRPCGHRAKEVQPARRTARNCSPACFPTRDAGEEARLRSFPSVLFPAPISTAGVKSPAFWLAADPEQSGLPSTSFLHPFVTKFAPQSTGTLFLFPTVTFPPTLAPSRNSPLSGKNP